MTSPSKTSLSVVLRVRRGRGRIMVPSCGQAMRINAYEMSGSPAQQTVYFAERLLLFLAEGIDFAGSFVDGGEGFAFVAVRHGNVDLAAESFI